jgi:3-deoxy-manno-octulosonate cytidylyltransferase (CMP-KDO synthetase)
MKTIAIIPARMAATRFPGKPMAKILGLPMIGHVYHRTKLCKDLDEVYVATCDSEIYDYIYSIGGKAVMTATTHERASDRSAEAIQIIEKKTGIQYDIVAMIQGDEPLIMPEMIGQGIAPLMADSQLKISNLIAELKTIEEFNDPNDVKIVLDAEGYAMYLSREPIPTVRNNNSDIPMLKQLGIIFFRKIFLIEYSKMPQTPLEIIESVDVLRIMENGIKIKTVLTEFVSIGVDTPEDLDKAQEIMKQDVLIAKYLSL